MTLLNLEPSERALKDRALSDLTARAHELKVAKAAYEDALYEAKHLKLANTIIARAVGVSEAAIRMYFKRNQRDGKK